MASEEHDVSTEHFTVQYTDALELQPADATVLTLVFRDDDGQFTPNLVFTVAEAETPVSDASIVALTSLRETYPAAWFPSIDVWGEDLEARRITMLYPADEVRDVCVRQWVWASGTHHIYATASFLPFQAHWAESQLESVVQSIEFTHPLARQVIGQATQFPINADLSMQAGVALEALDDIAPPAEPFRMPIGTQTIDLLERTVSKFRIGKRAYEISKADHGTESAAELDRIGFTKDGVLGPFGEQVGKTLTQGAVLANVGMQYEGRAETLTAIGRGAEVVLTHTAGTGAALPAGEARLVVCGIEQVLRLVLQWIDVPARFSMHREERVTQQEAERRIAAPMNADGWRRITIEVPGVSKLVVLVDVTGELFVIQRVDEESGDLTVMTQPPGVLFEELRALLWKRLQEAS